MWRKSELTIFFGKYQSSEISKISVAYFFTCENLVMVSVTASSVRTSKLIKKYRNSVLLILRKFSKQCSSDAPEVRNSKFFQVLTSSIAYFANRNSLNNGKHDCTFSQN